MVVEKIGTAGEPAEAADQTEEPKGLRAPTLCHPRNHTSEDNGSRRAAAVFRGGWRRARTLRGRLAYPFRVAKVLGLLAALMAFAATVPAIELSMP